MNPSGGVRFIMEDGSTECYDPIYGVTERDDKYVIDHASHTYELDMIDVSKVEYYDTCEKCGYELDNGDEDKICDRCKAVEFVIGSIPDIYKESLL